jgi:hypothetical protein
LNIRIRIKAAGKRRDMLELQNHSVPDSTDSAEKLIEYLVRENVRAFNAKQTDAPLFKYLSREELEDGVHRGKIDFGDKKSEAPQDEDAAVENALQCFADGIYRVLVNTTEARPAAEGDGASFLAEGDGVPFLTEGDVVTFIRLVMLAGRRF